MKIVRFFATSVVAFGIYLLLSMSLEVRELLIGAGVGILTGAITARFVPIKLQTFNPLRIVKAIIYAPVFLWKMIVANLQIAAIVVRPKLRINPSIVQARTDLPTQEGRLILTSSITLTPGTLTVDVKNNRVYVHWVNAKSTSDTEAQKQIIGPFEKHIQGISK